MGILDTIRSLLGLSTGADDRREGVGEVTVEHEPADSPDSPNEASDDATSDAATDEADSDATDGADTPAAAGGDATASTTSMVDEGAAGPDEAAEPPEATTPSDPPVDPEAGGAAESDAGVDVDAEGGDESADQPAASGTDATASTGSMVDEDVDGPEEAAEPPEATTASEPQVDPEAGGVAESDAGVESLVDEAEGDETGAEDGETEAEDHPDDGAPAADEDDGSDPVETVRGIGPAYATRLGDAGVETVADLAAADPTELAAAVEVAESRVERWVERARDRVA